jgi:hypothetical protein
MKLPIALVASALLGGLAALGALAVPTPVLETLVMDSGLPAVLAAAEPPLGFTARAALALGAGTFVGLIGGLAVLLLLGMRSIALRGADRPAFEDAPLPAIRRADAHPDAPPRPPLLATRDLGTPFLEIRASRDEMAEPAAAEPPQADEAVPAELHEEIAEAPPLEQPLPQDLDQPLAAFDPDALPEVPLEAPEVLPALSRAPTPPVFEENERFEVFELMPPAPPQAPAPTPREERITRPETEASVHALLERLERGVVRRGLTASEAVPERRSAERGLEDTLVTLRNLARRA